MILTYIAYFLLIVGAFFLFLGALGIMRFPDVYNRLQAGTKCTTLGASSSIIGVGLLHPAWLPKAIVITLFILLTNPVSSHALGRASYKSGVKLWKKSVVDKCKEFEQCHPRGEETREEEAVINEEKKL